MPTSPWASTRRCSGSMSTAISGLIASAASAVIRRTAAVASSSRLAPGAVQQQERVAVVGDEAEVGPEAELGHLPAGGRPGGGLGDRQQQPPADLVDQRQVQAPAWSRSAGRAPAWSRRRRRRRRSSTRRGTRCGRTPARRRRGSARDGPEAGSRGAIRSYPRVTGRVRRSQPSLAVLPLGGLHRVAEHDRRGQQDEADDEDDDRRSSPPPRRTRWRSR